MKPAIRFNEPACGSEEDRAGAKKREEEDGRAFRQVKPSSGVTASPSLGGEDKHIWLVVLGLISNRRRDPFQTEAGNGMKHEQVFQSNGRGLRIFQLSDATLTFIWQSQVLIRQ